jgi:hypothetical protein
MVARLKVFPKQPSKLSKTPQKRQTDIDKIYRSKT